MEKIEGKYKQDGNYTKHYLWRYWII